MNYFTILFLLDVQCVVFVKSGLFDDLEKSDLHALRQRLEEDKAQRLLLQNDVSILMLKVAQLERQLSTRNMGIFDSGCRTRNNQSVSFHASVSKQAYQQLTTGQIIIFDHVITNHGMGYSPSSGTFRAPKDGTYFFSMNLLAPQSKNIHASIFVNGDETAKFYTGTHDSWPNPGSQTLVTDLFQEDEVFIKVTIDGYIHGHNYDTFSGHLIN